MPEMRGTKQLKDAQAGSAEKVPLGSFERTVANIVIGVVFLTAFAYLCYFGIYRRLEVGDPEHWAQFGDYFGGVVNPIVAVVTALLVIRTLQVTRTEAETTRAEMQAQTSSLQTQVDLLSQEQKLIELQKRLDGALATWLRLMERTRANLNSDLFSHAGSLSTLESVLGVQDTYSKYDAFVEYVGSSEKARLQWCQYLAPELDVLKEIAQYCADYDENAGNAVLTDFYRRRVVRVARMLSELGVLEDEVYSMLEVEHV